MQVYLEYWLFDMFNIKGKKTTALSCHLSNFIAMFSSINNSITSSRFFVLIVDPLIAWSSIAWTYFFDTIYQVWTGIRRCIVMDLYILSYCVNGYYLRSNNDFFHASLLQGMFLALWSKISIKILNYWKGK